MIPLYDTIPSEKTPWVTWSLIAVCALAFAQQIALSTRGRGFRYVTKPDGATVKVPKSANDELVMRWGATPVAVVRGYIPRTRARATIFGVRVSTAKEPVPIERRVAPLLTSLFLHGSFLHFFSNMLFLFIFGDNVEDRLGHWRFLAFYLCGGALATLAHIVTAPSSATPVIGASGAISAVLGAYFILFPRALIVTFVLLLIIPMFLYVPAMFFIGLWFVVQVFSGLGSLVARGDDIAWWAHVGGFVFGGAVAIWNYKRWRRAPAPTPAVRAWGRR